MFTDLVEIWSSSIFSVGYYQCPATPKKIHQVVGAKKFHNDYHYSKVPNVKPTEVGQWVAL